MTNIIVAFIAGVAGAIPALLALFQSGRAHKQILLDSEIIAALNKNKEYLPWAHATELEMARQILRRDLETHHLRPPIFLAWMLLIALLFPLVVGSGVLLVMALMGVELSFSIFNNTILWEFIAYYIFSVLLVHVFEMKPPRVKGLPTERDQTTQPPTPADASDTHKP